MNGIRKCLIGFVVVAGCLLPLRVGAQGTLFVEGDNVGIGTETPAVPLHIKKTATVDTTMYRLENDGGNRFDFINNVPISGGWWQFVNTSNSGGADFVIRELTKNSTEELRLTESGKLTISGPIVTGGTSCGGGCDLVFDPSYDLPSIREHAERMWQQKHLPAVGPTPEGAPFNLTEKTGAMLNELELAHIYIERLEGQIAELNERLTRMEAGSDD